MAIVKVFKEKDYTKYGTHTFKNEIKHLNYLLTNYVVKEEKVLSKEWCGINCGDNPETAYQDMVDTKIKFNKYDPDNENSREFKHYTISFSPEESKKLGAYKINQICKEICERVPEFNNFEISITTHEDKKHIHNHIIINSVNKVDGHKIHLPKSFLDKFKAITNDYCKENNLEIPVKKQDRTGITYSYADLKSYQNGTISKAESFARKLENIIKNTNNKYDLFKVMKDNNLTMKWRDDKQYKDKLNVGKITIIDNETGEKHRLETLYKNYNIDISSNNDLLKHFEEIQKNREIIKNIAINDAKKVIKKDLLYKVKINDKIELAKLNNATKKSREILNENIDKPYFKLKMSEQRYFREMANILCSNNDKVKEIMKDKTIELINQAKEKNKKLDNKNAEIKVKGLIYDAIASKLFYEMKTNYKNSSISSMGSGFLLKAMGSCIKNIDYDNAINHNNLENEKYIRNVAEQEKAIQKAINY